MSWNSGLSKHINNILKKHFDRNECYDLVFLKKVSSYLKTKASRIDYIINTTSLTEEEKKTVRALALSGTKRISEVSSSSGIRPSRLRSHAVKRRYSQPRKTVEISNEEIQLLEDAIALNPKLGRSNAKELLKCSEWKAREALKLARLNILESTSNNIDQLSRPELG